MSNFKKAFIVTLSLSALMVTGYFGVKSLFYNGYLRMNYPSRAEFPVHGFDISHHQKEINWQLLKSEDFKFIYFKATEGGDFKDKRFQENFKKAQEVGFLVGGYHFFTFCKSAALQAKNFIDSVPNQKGTLAPAVDLEFGGNCQKEPTQAELEKELRVYMDRMRAHYNIEPVLYVTQEFYERYFAGRSVPHRLWVRDIYSRPNYLTSGTWDFWQYGNRGRVEGVETFIDLNVFRGNLDELILEFTIK